MDLAHRLWYDRTVFQQRADRQAAALVALFRALERNCPLSGGESEALDLHRYLLGLDADVVSAVLGDPYARFWTRLGFALCGAALRDEGVPPVAASFAEETGSDDPRTLLRAHLEEYKRLALAGALLAKGSLELATPFDAALPFAVPACDRTLVGSGSVRIGGAADGALLCDRQDVALEDCPRAQVGDWSVALQPAGWHVPGLGWSPLATDTSHAFQESHRPLIEDAVGMIVRYQPDLFHQMRDAVRWIAVNPLSQTSLFNYVSFSELPGAFAVQGLPNRYGTAGACVHEFHHNRLFAIEECEPILIGDALGTEDDAAYYSPWRENLRPLRGILHGAYVAIAELRFALAALRDPAMDPALRDFVVAHVIRHTLVIDIGLGQLERHGRFTPAGEGYLAQMRHDLAALSADAETLGVPRDVPRQTYDADGGLIPFRDETGRAMMMRESIAWHIRHFDTQRQVPADWIAANCVSPPPEPARIAASAR